MKAVEGYADDEEYSQPYRFLEHWYLVQRSTGDESAAANPASTSTFKRRLPIPPHCLFAEDYKDCVIAGWLQPQQRTSSSQQQQQAIFVELTEMEYCSVDRSKLYRGYWIHTPQSLYWLRQPDTATGFSSSEELPLRSQEQVHLAARAQLAVLSNVLDNVLLRPKAANLASKTVSQVHKEWTSAQLGLDADINIHDIDINIKEPFNKMLLAKFKAFVGQHLIDPASMIPFHPAYTAKSAFIKSLKASRAPTGGSSSVGLADTQLLAWTEQSEAASQQYPWGESTVPIDPALGDSLEAVLSDSTGMDCETDGGGMHCMMMSEEMENMIKDNGLYSNNKNGNEDSEMMTIKLVVEGAPLPDLLRVSSADNYFHYGKNNNNNNNNNNGDNRGHVKDQLGDSDSDDESYGSPAKRLKKLSKNKDKSPNKKMPKKRPVSSDVVKGRSGKKAKEVPVEIPAKRKKLSPKVDIPDDVWSPDRTTEALVRLYCTAVFVGCRLFACWFLLVCQS